MYPLSLATRLVAAPLKVLLIAEFSTDAVFSPALHIEGLQSGIVVDGFSSWIETKAFRVSRYLVLTPFFNTAWGKGPID